MIHRRKLLATACAIPLLGISISAAFGQEQQPAAQGAAAIRAEFANPGKAYRPMVRWWWPGNDVDAAEIRREVGELDLAGFGGAEIQPLSMNFPRDLPKERRARIFSVGTPGYFANVRAAVDEARRRGMWIDLTLGSGWPAGGGDAVTPELTNLELRHSEVAVKGGERFHGKLDLPDIGKSPVGQIVHASMGDPLTPYPEGWDERMRARAKTVAVSAYRVHPPEIGAAASPMPGAPPTVVRSGSLDLSSRVDLTSRVSADGTLDWQVPTGEWRVFAFREVAMDDQVVGDAIPGPRLIVDHFDKGAFDAWIRQFGDPMKATLSDRFGIGMRALFYDSLEIPADLYWSKDFLQQFERRRGYSLVPYLPLIIQAGFNNGYSSGVGLPHYDLPGTGAAVRRDYWKTVGELITERFYVPFNAWAKSNRLLTRTQAHGAPADLLTVYGQSDIPETEQMSQIDGSTGFSDNFLKIASSAADITGKRIVSSESFATSGDPYWTTPASIKAKADRFLTSGINQIVYHGYPYRYDDRPFPGWGAFNNGSATTSFAAFMSSRNTFWPYIRQVNGYISRLQYVSQNGTTVAPVALLTTRIGYGFSDTKDPLSVAALERAGYGYRHVNSEVLANAKVEGGALVTAGGARFKAVVIDNTDWLEPEAATALANAVRQGVGVVVLGPLPSRAASQRNFAADSAHVKDLVAAMARSPRFKHAESADGLIAALGQLTPPNARFVSGPALPFIQKRLGTLDTYFFRNPEDKPVTIEVEMSANGSPQLWDPWNGKVAPHGQFVGTGAGQRVTLSFEAHGSAMLVFDPADHHAPFPMATDPSTTVAMAIDGPWTFRGEGHIIDGSVTQISRSLPKLIDWAQDTELKGFSGRGTYSSRLELSATALAGVKRVVLDLGTVKDVAEVRINGRSTPALLMAPYTVDVTDFVRPGSNLVEITAVNSLSNAGSPRQPVYPMLDPSMEAARSYTPRSSGLLGPVQLRVAK